MLHLLRTRDTEQREAVGEHLPHGEREREPRLEVVGVRRGLEGALDVNRSFETLFGYLETEARGQYINSLLAPGPYLDDAQNISQTVLRNGQVGEKESIRCTKDGRPVEVSLIGYPIVMDRRVNGAYAIYRDITERKNTEERLIRSSRIFEDSLNEIYIFDADNLHFIFKSITAPRSILVMA